MYKPKQDRSFRVILKNVLPTFNTEDIKDAIEEIGHKVVNLWNIKQRIIKIPYPYLLLKALTHIHC